MSVGREAIQGPTPRTSASQLAKGYYGSTYGSVFVAGTAAHLNRLQSKALPLSKVWTFVCKHRSLKPRSLFSQLIGSVAGVRSEL